MAGMILSTYLFASFPPLESISVWWSDLSLGSRLNSLFTKTHVMVRQTNATPVEAVLYVGTAVAALTYPLQESEVLISL